MNVSSDPVDVQIEAYIDRLKKNLSCPLPSNIVVDGNITLERNHVFLPEHKDKKYLDYMAGLDERTALTGSEGEPELYGVIRGGSVVKILEIVENNVEGAIRSGEDTDEE